MVLQMFHLSVRPALLASILFGAGVIIPLIGQIISLFTPIPLILSIARFGMPTGLLAISIASLLVTGLAGWQAGAVMALGFGLLAAGVGHGIRRGARPETSVALGGLFPVIAAVSLLALYFTRTGADPTAALDAYFRESVQESVKLYESAGMKDVAVTIGGLSDSFIHYFIRLLPGLALATSFAHATGCYGFARAFLMRDPGPSPIPGTGTTFASWHAPDSWVWALIAALGLIAVPVETVRLTGLNAVIVLALVYTVQGMACVDHFLLKARLSPLVRPPIHALLMAMPSAVFVIALGVVDVWADVRKVRAAQPPA